MKNFCKLFSSDEILNSGTSEGVKKSWDTRKLGTSGEIYSKASPFAKAYVTSALWSSTDNKDDSGGEPLDKNYSHHDIHPASLQHMVDDAHKFESDNAEHVGSHSEQAGHDYWLNRNGHGTGFWDRPEVYGEDHAKALDAASKSAGGKDLYVAGGKIHQAGSENYKPDYQPTTRTTLPGHSVGFRSQGTSVAGDHEIPLHDKSAHYSNGHGTMENSKISSASNSLLNSALTGGVRLTVGQLAAGLTEALGDKLTNASITDILCPDESGYWAAVLDNSKVFFKLNEGKVLLNWEHKEKKDYQPWDEEPKVDGAWDKDLIGGGDEILNTWSDAAREAAAEARKEHSGASGAFEQKRREAFAADTKFQQAAPEEKEAARKNAFDAHSAAAAYGRAAGRDVEAQTHDRAVENYKPSTTVKPEPHWSGDKPHERAALVRQGIISGLD